MEDPNRQLDRAIEEVERLTDQRLVDELDGLLDQRIDPRSLMCPLGGGISGDIDRSAVDLHWAAVFATRIRPDARVVDPEQLLARTLEHQQRHVERMKQMVLAPRTREGVAYWSVHRLKSTWADAQARALIQAETYLTELTARGSEDLELQGERTRGEDATRHKLLRSTVNRLLRSHFLVGDDAAAMEIARAWFERSGDTDTLARITGLNAIELEAAGRLVRATQHIDSENDTLALLGPGNFTNQIAARLGERATDDDPRALLRGRNEGFPEGNASYTRQVAPRDNLRQIQHAVRAYLRDPERYGGRNMGLSFHDTDQKVLRCVVPVGAAGMSEFIDHNRGITPAMVRIIDQPRGAKGFNHDLYLTASTTVRVRGREVAIDAVLPLGQNRAHPGSAARERFIHGRLVDLLGSDALSDAPVIESQISLRPGLYAEDPRHRSAPTPQAEAAAVLGDRHCSHPRATWLEAVAINRSIPPARRLACPDCLRTRIAVEPLHRRPEGLSDEAIVNPSKYLRAEAYLSVLRGEPVAWSLDELRQRDGLASSEPADYASGKPRLHSPGLDIDSALSSRRR